MRSTPLLPRLAALVCAAAFLLFTIPGQAEQSLQVLHNHVRPAVASGQAAPVGALPSTQRMNLAIQLPIRNQAELTSFLDRLYDPSSPDFHQFLSVAEFTERFGPTAQDYETVVNFAKANGFTVTDTPANRLLVDINGSVSQIEKAFHVVMTVYQHPTEARTFYSPDREPSLDLSVPVSHIAGLNNFSIPRPMLKRLPAGAEVHSNATGSGPKGAYRPSDMRAAYYGGTALTGTGQSVGMLEFDGYTASDVTGDEGGVTYTVPITNVLVDGASAGSDGDDGEQALDIAQAIGMAPGLTSVRVYIAPGTSAIGVGDVDIFNKMATDNISKSLSCSWGWNPDDTSSDDPIFQEFAAQGQNLFVASGDAGAYTGSNATDSSYPAEDVFVVAVGGTDLTTNGAGGTWESETAWADSSGGPADNGFAIPSWQAGIANSSNGASSTIRDLPDVAAEANFDNILCDDGTCTDNETGGTSYAAPRWAGYLALVNQQAVTNTGKTLGFINPAIYAIGKSTSYDTDFHDITSGNNNNGNGKSFNAVTGYDLVTGWGSPNGANLINALAGSGTPSFTLSDSPSSLTITQGGAAGTSTVTVTDVGGFTGSVTLAASGLPSGVTATFGTNPTTGTSTLSLTASATATTGTSTVTITGTSGSLTATTTLALTVSAAAAPNFTLSASPSSLSVTQGSSGTSTISVTDKNGFTGSVTLAASGLPSGVTAAFGTNPTTGSSVLTLTASATATTGTSTVTITGTSGSLTATTTLALTVNASTATKNFTLSLSPASFTVDENGSVSTTLTVTSVGGFHSAVTLSVNKFPTDVSATASANPVTPPANGIVKVTLTWSATRRAPTGTTTIELIGTSGSLTNQIPVTITVAP
jgi:subtilase family serine protease